MAKRMSWKEIQAAYPNQRVALSNVEYEPGPGIAIKSGEVVCAEADGYSRMQMRSIAVRSGGAIICQPTGMGSSKGVRVGLISVCFMA